MTTRVAVTGASGKLGSLIAEVVEQTPGFELVLRLGRGAALEQLHEVDLVADATTPGASPAIVEHALAHGVNVLVGTSGWSQDRIAALERTITGNLAVGVVIVPNFSLGSVLASSFAAVAGRYYDSIEIIESHHAGKIDSPSGTAVRTAELIVAARKGLDPVDAPHSDQRARGQSVGGIPVHSLRMAGVVAQQEVILGGPGEQVRLRHDTLSGEAYRAGIRLALEAARDARGVTVGLDAVLGLDRLWRSTEPAAAAPDAPAAAAPAGDGSRQPGAAPGGTA